MDKLKYVKLENEDGSYSQSIPLSVDANYIDINGDNLKDVVDRKADSDLVNGQIENLRNSINSVASGSPAGVYATVSQLTTTDPNHAKIYVVTETGCWYYWSGTQWSEGGIYQAVQDDRTLVRLQDQIDSISIPSDNLCPFYHFTAYTNIQNGNGIYMPPRSAQVNTCASEIYIDVVPGKTYVFWREGDIQDVTYYVFLYDANKNFTREVHTYNAQGSACYVTIDSTEYYARLKVNKGNSTVLMSEWTGWMFEESPKSESFCRPYQLNIPEESIGEEQLQDNSIGGEKIKDSSIGGEKLTIFEPTENLWLGENFLPNSNLNVTTGLYFISPNNVNTVAVEKYIEIEPDTYYNFSCECPVETRYISWYYYDDTYTFLSSKSGETAKSLSNAKYARIKINATNKTVELSQTTKMCLIKGSSAPKHYIPPYQIAWDYIDSSDLEERIAEITTDNKSVKLGKKLLDEVRPTVLNYNRNHKFLNFAFLTDTHINEIPEGNYPDNNIEIFKILCNERWLDFGAHGGDIYTAYNLSNKEALQTLDRAMQKFGEINIPFFTAKGNHDCNGKYIPLADLEDLDWNSHVYYIFDEDSHSYIAIQQNEWDGTTPLHVGSRDNNERITNYQYYMLCNNNLNADVVFNPDDYYGNYYYKDFDKEGIRIIVLNVYDSQNLEDFGIHEPQLSWIRDVALNTDKKVIFFSHMYFANANADFNTIVRNFINNGGTVIGMIHGDRHQDLYNNLNYNVIGVGAAYGTRSALGTKNEFLISIFTIDTEDNIIYETRIGKGSSRKYSFEGSGSQIID